MSTTRTDKADLDVVKNLTKFFEILPKVFEDPKKLAERMVTTEPESFTDAMATTALAALVRIKATGSPDALPVLERARQAEHSYSVKVHHLLMHRPAISDHEVAVLNREFRRGLDCEHAIDEAIKACTAPGHAAPAKHWWNRA